MRHLTGVWARRTTGNAIAAVPAATAPALMSPRRDVALGVLGSVVMPVFPSLGARGPGRPGSDLMGATRGDYRLRRSTCQETAPVDRSLTREGHPDSIPPDRRSTPHVRKRDRGPRRVHRSGPGDAVGPGREDPPPPPGVLAAGLARAVGLPHPRV